MRQSTMTLDDSSVERISSQLTPVDRFKRLGNGSECLSVKYNGVWIATSFNVSPRRWVFSNKNKKKSWNRCAMVTLATYTTLHFKFRFPFGEHREPRHIEVNRTLIRRLTQIRKRKLKRRRRIINKTTINSPCRIVRERPLEREDWRFDHNCESEFCHLISSGSLPLNKKKYPEKNEKVSRKPYNIRVQRDLGRKAAMCVAQREREGHESEQW